MQQATATDKYKIIRHKAKGRNKIIARGVSLKVAQKHCRRKDTKGEGWFDGYERE